MSKIFAIMENNAPHSFELLTVAKALATQLEPRASVSALYLPKDAGISPKFFADLIVQLIKENSPEIVLFSASRLGRELAPRVSSTLETGLTADCTSLRIENNKLVSVRPTFGGRLMAEILCKRLPQMATLRPGALKITEIEGVVEEIYLNSPDLQPELKIIKLTKNEHPASNLSEAKIVFTGGKGLKTKENFDKLCELAAKLNVAVGATRGAVEAGLAPKYMQVGQTGISIAPEIYVTFGVSGAIHHMIGVENAREIIAVNNDPSAPIFSTCDYKICADAIEMLDKLLASP